MTRTEKEEEDKKESFSFLSHAHLQVPLLIMSKFEKEMRFYAAYHNHPANQMIHIIFVPLIVVSLLALFSSFSTILATGAIALYALYYLQMDVKLGVAAMPFLFSWWWLGNYWAASTPSIWRAFLGTQIVSWGVQVAVGHYVFEKRSPALLDSWQQSFLLAPLFVIVEFLMMIGFFPELSKRVRRQAELDIAEAKKKKK